MRQYILEHRKDLSGITLKEDAEKPKITDGKQVLVKLKALSLNARDLQIATNTYPAPHPIPEPLVPVSDGAGEIVEVGSDVQDFKVGDRVTVNIFQGYQKGEDVTPEHMIRGLGGAVHGIASEYFLLDASDLVHLPQHMSFEEGSTLPIAATTAWNSLYGHHPKLQAGQTVLCLGTGGVSLFAAQIALAAGAQVILTSSSDDKLARVKKELEASLGGVIQTINYSTHPDWEKQVVELTGGRKCDFVIEIGGKGTLAKSIRSTRQGGLVAVSGYMTDYGKQADNGSEDIAKEILYSAANVRGNFVSSRESFVEMNRALEARHVKPIIDRTFTFDQLREAYEYLQSGSHVGKVVVTAP